MRRRRSGATRRRTAWRPRCARRPILRRRRAWETRSPGGPGSPVSSRPRDDADVLIVGSGPAGLTAAVLLADLGVRSVLVERNPSTTDHPRAHVVNTRTMEIFRRIGIANAVTAAAIPDEWLARVLWKQTLAGRELGALELGL